MFAAHSTKRFTAALSRKALPINKGYGVVPRNASTSKDTKVPGNPEHPYMASVPFLDVKLPIPEVDPELPINMPYVPDFWHSAKLVPEQPSMDTPKVVVVGGTQTSHGSARPHNIEEINVLVESDSTELSKERSDSFWDDVTEELKLPSVHEIQSSFRKIFS